MVAIIRECTTDAGLGVTWCQLDETPMTGFAIKCTFICSQDLCNSLPLHLNKPKAENVHNKGDKPFPDLSTTTIAALLLTIAIQEFQWPEKKRYIWGINQNYEVKRLQLKWMWNVNHIPRWKFYEATRFPYSLDYSVVCHQLPFRDPIHRWLKRRCL